MDQRRWRWSQKQSMPHFTHTYATWPAARQSASSRRSNQGILSEPESQGGAKDNGTRSLKHIKSWGDCCGIQVLYSSASSFLFHNPQSTSVGAKIRTSWPSKHRYIVREIIDLRESDSNNKHGDECLKDDWFLIKHTLYRNTSRLINTHLPW